MLGVLVYPAFSASHCPALSVRIRHVIPMKIAPSLLYLRLPRRSPEGDGPLWRESRVSLRNSFLKPFWASGWFPPTFDLEPLGAANASPSRIGPLAIGALDDYARYILHTPTKVLPMSTV